MQASFFAPCIGSLCLALGFLAACGPSVTQTVASPAIEIVNGGIEIRGLSEAGTDGALTASPETLQSMMTVTVEGNELLELPPVAGTVEALGDDTLRFQPRFPLRAGVHYLVLLETDEPIAGIVSLPEPPASEPSTRVSAIFPSGKKLPENLLRFYLHFDGPMAQGDSYRFVSLRDHHGVEVPDSFLELEEELWNPQGTRLTLLFDPGRIKSGLKPKLEVGSALSANHHFELVVDQQWPDASGTPLASGFGHRFQTTAPDYTLPDPKAWALSSPQVNSLEPLTVRLDEPLDRALAARLISVEKDGQQFSGEVEVEDGETTWRFLPERLWSDAVHQLVIDVRLEDRAGNRIDRAFERESSSSAMNHESQPAIADSPSFVKLDIELRPAE